MDRLQFYDGLMSIRAMNPSHLTGYGSNQVGVISITFINKIDYVNYKTLFGF